MVVFCRWSRLPRKILREEEKVKDLLRCEVTSRNMVLLHALECTFDTQTIPTCTSVMFCTDSICNKSKSPNRLVFCENNSVLMAHSITLLFPSVGLISWQCCCVTVDVLTTDLLFLDVSETIRSSFAQSRSRSGALDSFASSSVLADSLVKCPVILLIEILHI